MRTSRTTAFVIFMNVFILACDGSAPGAEDDVDAGALPEELVLLANGSREHDGVLNLVNPTAAAELDDYLLTDGNSLAGPTNAFLEFYEEDYDFLFFFTDHTLDTTLSAAFIPINQAASPGGDAPVDIRAPGYRTNGRLKGAVGINGSGGPIPHEMLHYWANHLDARFGFGKGLVDNFPSHWGYSSVYGQLGGFDGSTLRCVDPSDAVPPHCNEVTPGRFEVAVGYYAPHVNNTQPYAPLELYLMGLIPKSEVAPVLVLDEAVEVARMGDDFVLEAGGVHEVSIEDIIAVHGENALLPEDERAFRAAYVLVSAEPATEQAMADLADYAKAFANPDPKALYGFGKFTGGRATISTQLGSRRRLSSPLPPPR